MPDWDPEANDLFLRALEITEPDDRKRFLDEACAAQPALRARVEALIRSHERAGEFLGRPILEPAGGSAPGGNATRTDPAAVGDASLDFLTASDKPGSLGRLGHYEVQAIIGRGGMGVVLKAFDENLHRVVAIKVMVPQLAASATARQRFTREARAQAAVAHEHVVTIHSVEEANGLPYIVMQYVAGTSLQDRLDRDGSLRLQEVLRIGVQAAAGLAAAHKQGLVHRDIKPANILLENGVERVKLTDFGLARAADDASLTASGQIAGTPQYMSPEQAEGEPVDARSDLFSLGSVLYAMCAGRPPFRAASTMAVLKRVCEDTPTPIQEVNPEVPEWLAEVIAKLQAKHPTERFQGADEVTDLLVGLLARVQRPSGVAEKPTAPKSAQRRRRWAAAALLVLLAAGLVTTEVTSVTRLRATVARFFRPDEPSATEDGPAIPQPPSVPGPVEPVRPAAAPVVGSGQFVMLGGGGAADRAFPTLAAAVQATADGYTVEVRGDGPFVSAAIPPMHGRRLTIRAAAGTRPVLIWNGDGGSEVYPSRPALLSTDVDLAVEGLEFQAVPSLPARLIGNLIQATNGGTVWATNCRFRSLLVDRSGYQTLTGIRAWEAGCVVRNSSFFGFRDGGAVLSTMAARVPPRKRSLVVENCVFAGDGGFHPWLAANTFNQSGQSSPVCLTNNTFAGGTIRVYWVASLLKLAEKPEVKLYDFESSGNVFGLPALFSIGTAGNPDVLREVNQIQKPSDAERVLRTLISWRAQSNVYTDGINFYTVFGKNNQLYRSEMRLKEWADYSGVPALDSLQGRVHFRGGNLAARLFDDPNALTEADFRLQDDSTGKGARRDGEDLGADVDLVGPGAAYEKWKMTLAYRQWLKDSGQKK